MDDDNDFYEEETNSEPSASLNDYAIEEAGFMDGESDANLKMPLYSSYGSSLQLEELTDAQRDLYDNAYHSGNSLIDPLFDENEF